MVQYRVVAPADDGLEILRADLFEDDAAPFEAQGRFFLVAHALHLSSAFPFRFRQGFSCVYNSLLS